MPTTIYTSPQQKTTGITHQHQHKHPKTRTFFQYFCHIDQLAMDRAINRTYEEYTPVVEWSHSADASFVKIIVPGK
jgi:hypothetical protein